MPVAHYMELCLTDPERGYYARRDPFGAAGDFTTAPEISQMFGELIGLWAAATWRAMGSPGEINLVELGPGRGTMMVDVLRTARVMPDFLAAIHVHLIEIRWTWMAARKSGITLAVRSTSTIMVPRPGPSSTKLISPGDPIARQVAAAHNPINSPNIWLISGAVVKSPAAPNGSRLA